MTVSTAPARGHRAPRLSRWSIFWRYALAVINWGLSVFTLGGINWMARRDPELGFSGPPLWMVGTDLVIGFGCLFLVRFRRRWPLLMCLGFGLASLVAPSLSFLSSWCLVSLATRRRWLPIVVGTLSLVPLSVLQLMADGNAAMSDPRALAAVVVMAVVFELALVMMGLFVGARRDLIAALEERADTAEREQELRVLQGQAAERNRIAREMHDVLAHRMSLVSMHAGILAFREDLSTEETREIAQVIQENAHASLTELRGVLSSLRENDADAPAVVAPPQPRALDVDDLVAEARASGERIDYSNELEHPELLPSVTARHGYRVVQEALTNARKHAPHQRVHLELRGGPGKGLLIRARNPMPLFRDEEGPSVPGSKVGLVGVRERVDVTGGRMDTKVEDGMFELEVWLPW